MGLMQRRSWPGFWQPDADNVNCPPDALLRADNLILDEMGIVALRPGSAHVSNLSSADVHSLQTFSLSGTRYRMAGATNAIYANGSVILGGVAGSGDVSFGSYRGQIFAARSTSKIKYDGSTVRNWGIEMSGMLPTVAPAAADSKTLATCNTGEAGLAVDEDDGTGLGHDTGSDGTTANGALVLITDGDTCRGSWYRSFAAADYTVYDAATPGTDEDFFEFYCYLAEPNDIISIAVMVDVNSSSASDFQDDYYTWEFIQDRSTDLELSEAEALRRNYSTEHSRIRPRVGPATGLAVSRFRLDLPAGNAGWSKMRVKRGQMLRVGDTPGKDWKTVCGVKFIVRSTKSTEVRFDAVRLVTGTFSTVKYRYVYVRNSDYTAKSAPSALSAETSIYTTGAVVTCPADAGRDSQANEIWLFRMGNHLNDWYRVAVQAIAGAGAVAITDTTSDQTALETAIKLEADNAEPPDSIIGIEGPYFDRLFALTAKDLYPSRQLNPDSFSAGQVINIAGVEEVAYWVRKAFGGLYVGTSKDIYRIDGDGAELPDGTVNFTKRELNVSHPPISEAVASEGNLLVYLANDGWRVLAGEGSQPLSGTTSLLYRGYTRHGVSAVNLSGGRFRAAIAKGQLVAIVPEGASTTSSTVLYRYNFASQKWYRHVYAVNWRSIAREPDGTLIAGDNASWTWQLDTGTQDNGANIAVTMWTHVDDDGTPLNRKDPWDFRARLDTGGANASVAVHLDGSAVAAGTLTLTSSGMAILVPSDLSAYTTFRQIQLRTTGSFSTFRWYDHALTYRERPVLQVFAEQKPEVPSLQRRRFGGLQLIIDTLNADATVTPVLDDVDQTALTVSTNDARGQTLTFSSVIGRDLWAKVSKATGFELYRIEPLIIETLPPQMKGQVPYTNAGYNGEKVMTGLKLKVCTLGAARTFTPIIDGVNQTAFTVTTDANEPDTYIHQFTEPLTGTDIAWSVDGNVEPYDWEPLVLYQLPVRVKVWENKPLVRSPVRRRFGGLVFQVWTFGEDVTVTPVVDGVDQATLTLNTDDLLAQVKTFSTDVGRDLWCRISGATPFCAHTVEPIVVETFPQLLKGLTPRKDGGYPGAKTLSGIQLKACTLGAACTVTPYFDGVAGTAQSFLTGADEPNIEVMEFATPATATDIALRFSTDVELYDWQPVVTARLPIGVKTWDSGPIDLGGKELVWIKEIRLKARAAANLTVTCYFDDVPWPVQTITVPSSKANQTTVHYLQLGRGYKGLVPRVRVTSTATFYPYELEFIRRTTGTAFDKPSIKVPVGLGG